MLVLKRRESANRSEWILDTPDLPPFWTETMELYQGHQDVYEDWSLNSTVLAYMFRISNCESEIEDPVTVISSRPTNFEHGSYWNLPCITRRFIQQGPGFSPNSSSVEIVPSGSQFLAHLHLFLGFRCREAFVKPQVWESPAVLHGMWMPLL